MIYVGAHVRGILMVWHWLSPNSLILCNRIMLSLVKKDYQQLAVIRQFVQDLNIPLEVIGVPIVRAEDGLALSSRNGYLTPEQRQVAPVIYQGLKQAEEQLHQGKDLQQVLADLKTLLTDNGFVVDYVEARQPNLLAASQFDRDIVLFVAAKLGGTRLIDNLQVAFTPQ